MRQLILFLLIGTLCSCANLQERFKNNAEPNMSGATPSVLPELSLSDLIQHRSNLCQQDKNLRADQLKQLRTKAQKSRRNSKISNLNQNEKFDGLLLATCDLATNNVVAGEMLNQLTSDGDWPADYTAFFDLLRTQVRTLAQMQNHTQDLTKELDNTKAELEESQANYKKTIKGISDIEENIDSRKIKSPHRDEARKP